jgi:SAM-dependent methyltransferase
LNGSFPSMKSPAAPENQAEYWNGEGGLTWVRLQDLLDQVLAPFGRRVLERAAPRPGERVVDVGCGCGHSTLELAKRVGPNGSALGIDLSEPMIARARQRAMEQGASGLQFVAADATRHAFDGTADLLFSRFGVMFFPDPAAAFAHLRGALKPGGRAVFITWRPPQLNHWMYVPLNAALQLLPPPEPADPDAPGPFSLSSRPRFETLLAGAGFTQIAFEPCDDGMRIGANVEEGLAYTLAVGATRRALAEVSSDVREKASQAIRASLVPYQTPSGVILPAATWLVTARAGS